MAMSPLSLPDKPSIAVLPFANLSGDPEQEYFVDGMVEEIITALSRIRWFFVIARNSSFTYKGQAVDVKQVGRELGVRYVLEGSVRKAGNRVRITAQLIDAMTGYHRPYRLRSLPARACDRLSDSEGADFRGSGIARAGDCDRSELWAGALLGGDLPHAARH
jgi:TolB-like protein